MAMRRLVHGTRERGGKWSRRLAVTRTTLLRRHSAHATFFVCTKYLEGCEVQAQTLVANGHELGNHMGEDLNFVYPKMEPSQFDAALADASASIERPLS